MILKSISGKIIHLKELAFIEQMLFNEVISPADYYKALEKFLTNNFDLAELTFWKRADLERIDAFTYSYFTGKINESKLWLMRAYIVGRYLAESDGAGLAFKMPQLQQLPKAVEEAMKKYGLTVQEAQALQAAIDSAAVNMTNTTTNTIEKVRESLVENTKTHGNARGALKQIEELLLKKGGDIGELGRDWQRVCFPSGTLILTKRGKIPIERMKVGDEVLTIGSKFERKVIQLHEKKYTGYLYTIQTASGKSITATAEHPIRVRRNNRNVWVPISQITESDEVFGVDGYETYYDKEWLYQKHVVEELDCTKIAEMVNVNPETIRANLKLFGIEVNKSLAFKGRHHSEETNKKKSQIAKKNNYSDRLNAPNAQLKAKESLKKKYETGEIKVWNKGESKKTNLSVQKISNKLKDGYAQGRKVWSRGLTKETSAIIRDSAKKTKITNRLNPERVNERITKQSSTLSKHISTGQIEPYSKAKVSHLINPFTKANEYLNSSFERKYAQYCIQNNIYYEKNHGIVIPYINSKGNKRNYVPDFVTVDSIVEIKAGWVVKNNHENHERKMKTAAQYAKSVGKQFIILTEVELGQM